MSEETQRGRYGALCGALGIALNLLLFAAKLAAGLVSGSIAVLSDAFNNMTDAASSILTIIGFRLSLQKPDPDHPFGHGRMEQITGLIISGLILLTGYELLTSSVSAILHPQEVQFGLLPALVLVLSIGVKGYMYAYNRAVGKRIDSAPLRACATDSLSDMASTALVLSSMLLSHFCGLQIDGYCGVLVSLFILKAAYDAARDTMGELLGRAPRRELVEQIEHLVLSYPEIIDIHDLVVHDYGAGRLMVTLHAEVPLDGDLLSLHSVVDDAERALKERLGCVATIHIDPIRTQDTHINELYRQVKALVQDFDPQLSLHDFRIAPGPIHTNIIFDIVVPHRYRLSDEQLEEVISARVHALAPEYRAVIEIERSYTG